ncbi:NADH-quinone oxidoreductase subunit M [Propionibacteriaceae bacterium Y1685]|uniref:NADH-quinone oxidoreductase subunit M n=1 Tax=Microlunatus sp. Y1700 TaxID=3418487 RepID=UPI003B7A3EBE
MTFPMLTVLALVPMVGALLTVALHGQAARIAGLVFSLAALAVAIGVAVQFDPAGGMQFVEQAPWIPAFGASYALGVDGIGLVLVLLTAILTPIVLWATWDDVDTENHRFGSRGFVGLVLAMESLSLFVFTATDVLLFYVFFEATLIPMYFLIGGFGGVKAKAAAIKFLLFSLFGGLVMLASVVGLYGASAAAGKPSYLLADLVNLDLGGVQGQWLFLGFMIAFAVKAPMVPFHTWLPDAAEESTPGGATLMVGILDKIGTFGMIRFCLGLFPEASAWATPVVLVLAVISILYGALAAIGSKDLYRLIAFTSISHFGFIVLGIFAFTSQSMAGSTLYMLNHGFSTAALFLVVGYLVKRRGSRQSDDFGGVQKVAPWLAGFTLFAGLSSLALPGLSSFVSEFMVISGTFSRHPVFGAIATLGVVLAALYILIMYQRTMTGPVSAQVADLPDLGAREKSALVPLVLLILAIGFFPKPVLDVINPAVTTVMQQVGVTDPEPLIGQEQPR